MLLDRKTAFHPDLTHLLTITLQKTKPVVEQGQANKSQPSNRQQQVLQSATHVKRTYQVSLESMRVQSSQILIPTKTATVPETSD